MDGSTGFDTRTDMPGPDREFEDADIEYRAAADELSRARTRFINAEQRKNRASRSWAARYLNDTSASTE